MQAQAHEPLGEDAEGHLMRLLLFYLVVGLVCGGKRGWDGMGPGLVLVLVDWWCVCVVCLVFLGGGERRERSPVGAWCVYLFLGWGWVGWVCGFVWVWGGVGLVLFLHVCCSSSPPSIPPTHLEHDAEEALAALEGRQLLGVLLLRQRQHVAVWC